MRDGRFQRRLVCLECSHNVRAARPTGRHHGSQQMRAADVPSCRRCWGYRGDGSAELGSALPRVRCGEPLGEYDRFFWFSRRDTLQILSILKSVRKGSPVLDGKFVIESSFYGQELTRMHTKNYTYFPFMAQMVLYNQAKQDTWCHGIPSVKTKNGEDASETGGRRQQPPGQRACDARSLAAAREAGSLSHRGAGSPCGVSSSHALGIF
jgi:hypothetical protein